MNDKNIKKIIIIAVIVFAILIIGSSIFIVLLSKNNKNESEIENNVAINSTEEEVDENTVDVQEKDEKEVNITYVATSDGSEIPVPEGFTYVEGTVTSGAVIEDENGNQFVWVPVNYIFARRNFRNVAVTDNVNFYEDENEEYTNSVEKYQGFYIGRYEASKNEEDDTKACTVAGVEPWTEIVYSKMQTIAQNTYADNSSVMSDLPSSYIWDTICYWLSESGYDITNSTSYGNYSNSSEGTGTKAKTGRNSKWVTNNIYDLAGNVWEMTTEKWGEVYDVNHTGRGGGYKSSGAEYSIACKIAEYDGSYSCIGFRLTLYLK